MVVVVVADHPVMRVGLHGRRRERGRQGHCSDKNFHWFSSRREASPESYDWKANFWNAQDSPRFTPGLVI
jgi:hypothetical protein